MRPTPRACRAAVHSIVPRNSQALWITDDALADALQRYTNVSDAARRSGSKRFGSNVPGPLEARRRRTGRRMGGLSSAVGPPDALPDFGALFGGPSAARTPIEKSWKWEPPRPAGQSLTPPDVCPTPAPTFEIPDLQFVEYDPVEQFRERLQPVKRPVIALRHMKKFKIEPEDQAIFSQVACDHFIALTVAGRRDGHKNLFKFVLRNPHDVLEAGIVKRVAQHLASTGFHMSRDLDDFISKFLPSACRRGKVSASDLSEILELLPSVCHKSFENDEREAQSWLLKAFWNIWRALRKDCMQAGIVKNVVQHLASTGFYTSHNLDYFVSKVLPFACRRAQLSASDLSEVLELLPSVCYNSFKHDEREAKPWLFMGYWNIWRALRTKMALPWESIDKGTVRKVAEHVVSIPDALPTSASQCQKPQLQRPETAFLPFRLQLYTSAWPVTVSPSDVLPPECILASWARQLVGLEPSESTTSGGLNWQVLISVVDSLPNAKAQWVMNAATRQLLDDRVDLQSSEFLPAWISCFSRARHCLTPDIPSYRLKVFEVIPALADLMDPVVAAQHLDNADPVNLARGWLRAWLPRYAEEQDSLGRWDAQHTKLKVGFEQGVRTMNKLRGYDDTKMFELIFRLFADFGIVCQTGMEKAMRLILERQGPEEILRLVHRLKTRDIFLQNPTFLAPIIEAIAEERPLRAFEIFKKTPGMWVSLCPNLPLALIAHGALKREEFFGLMNRWPKIHQGILSEEEFAAKKDELALLRSEMVHFVAFAWADADVLPPRVRFRNVWWCWRYLLDMKLPLSPLLSKAFVRSGITAPLQQHQWVSRKKISWIFEKFVRPLEGEYVEQELGRLIHAWRGDLIQESRRRWDAAGFFDRYGPSTVEAVRRAGLFEHDFPRRSGPVRRKYVRPGRNAAERYPRQWNDRTYTALPARDLLRWQRTPVLGSSRSRPAESYQKVLLNGRWRTWFKSAMKRWKQRKEKRRALRATKTGLRSLLNGDKVTDPAKLALLKGVKRDMTLVRRSKGEKSKVMDSASVWERKLIERGEAKKGKPFPRAAKPGENIARKVAVDGKHRPPPHWWK
ncbi:hypothetical protein IWX90DRAFT_483245 [Phyllosticta citrichinensis]|uniref:Uncharacterized protein n=1 Tax=Phyllosticta citrichinensis TaxID=1130410 RepID=A0ABR1Y1T1_9PEZI